MTGPDPSEEVVQAVAEAKDVTPTDLAPLYNAVEPDALDTIVSSTNVQQVAFEYEGYVVEVEPGGGVSLETS